MGLFFSIENERKELRTKLYKIFRKTSNKYKSDFYMSYKNNSTVIILPVNIKINIDNIKDLYKNKLLLLSEEELKHITFECVTILNKQLSNKLYINIKENDLIFHQDDVNSVQKVIEELFYNLFDDKISYDKVFMYILSYVSTKQFISVDMNKDSNKSKVKDMLAYYCLQDWYSKYETCKKNIYTYYQKLVDIIEGFVMNPSYIDELVNTEPFKSYPLNKYYKYYAKQILESIKHKIYHNTTYIEYLKKRLTTLYRTFSYNTTNYKQLRSISISLLKDSAQLFLFITDWIILYNLQCLEKKSTDNYLIIQASHYKIIYENIVNMGFNMI